MISAFIAKHPTLWKWLEDAAFYLLVLFCLLLSNGMLMPSLVDHSQALRLIKANGYLPQNWTVEANFIQFTVVAVVVLSVILYCSAAVVARMLKKQTISFWNSVSLAAVIFAMPGFVVVFWHLFISALAAPFLPFAIGAESIWYTFGVSREDAWVFLLANAIVWPAIHYGSKFLRGQKWKN